MRHICNRVLGECKKKSGKIPQVVASDDMWRATGILFTDLNFFFFTC